MPQYDSNYLTDVSQLKQQEQIFERAGMADMSFEVMNISVNSFKNRKSAQIFKKSMLAKDDESSHLGMRKRWGLKQTLISKKW